MHMRHLMVCLIALVTAFVVSCLPITQPATAPWPKADTRTVLEGNTRFAFDLYSRLRTQQGNLFLSPFSLSSALAMTSAGARGHTLEQMTSVLHLPSQEETHAAMAQLLRQVNNRQSRRIELRTANALWAQKGHPFRDDYLRRMRSSYGAGFHEVDFTRSPEPSRRTINAWVETQTRNRIQQLLRPGLIDSLTRLVLTNAIYFKGDWQKPFPKNDSRKEPFTKPDGRQVSTMLMHREATFAYGEDADLQTLEMPYSGQELSIVVLLPRKPDGLPELEKKLTAENLTRWLAGLRSREVNVTLPKFKMTREFALEQVLAAMGMTDAFTASADFSGMDDGHGQLQLSAVVHKAFIDVTEEGTEAAAATAVCVTVGVAPGLTPPPPPVFRADHPFLFLIRDRQTGSILFLGRLVDPGN
jgi:serpin B